MTRTEVNYNMDKPEKQETDDFKLGQNSFENFEKTL